MLRGDVKESGENANDCYYYQGWMTSRTDLSDEKMKADYEKGYKTVLQFL